MGFWKNGLKENIIEEELTSFGKFFNSQSFKILLFQQVPEVGEFRLNGNPNNPKF